MHTKVNQFRCIIVAMLIVFGMVFVATACAPAVTPQPGIGPATSDANMQQTLDVLRSQLNQTSTAEKKVLLQQATADALTRTAAVTPIPTSTFTPTPNLLGTQAASAMFLKVKQYARDNYLPSTSGIYHRLPNHSNYSKDFNNYTWTDTGLKLDDFVLESDVGWENSTSTIGNSRAGCGFIFHSDGVNHYSMAHIGLDGYAYLDLRNGSENSSLGRASFGKVEISKGSAHIALVVNGNHYAFFVNDKMIVQSTAASDTQETGKLAYTVYSGSSKLLGTTCTFTNIDLWTVKPSD